MSASKPAPLVVHDWTVFAHPLFLAQLEALAQQVEAFKLKDPVGYVKKNATKRLAAITKLAFDVIPQDPARPEYPARQHPRRRAQALVSCQVLPAVPVVFPIPRAKQGDRVGVGE